MRLMLSTFPAISPFRGAREYEHLRVPVWEKEKRGTDGKTSKYTGNSRRENRAHVTLVLHRIYPFFHYFSQLLSFLSDHFHRKSSSHFLPLLPYWANFRCYLHFLHCSRHIIFQFPGSLFRLFFPPSLALNPGFYLWFLVITFPSYPSSFLPPTTNGWCLESGSRIPFCFS